MRAALFKTTTRLSSSASQSGGEQSEIVGVSSMKSLSQISHREAKKWEAIRRLSLPLYLPLALSITLSAPARPHACQHDCSQHGWSATRFCLHSPTQKADGLRFVLLSSPAFPLRCRQMIAFKLLIFIHSSVRTQQGGMRLCRRLLCLFGSTGLWVNVSKVNLGVAWFKKMFFLQHLFI